MTAKRSGGPNHDVSHYTYRVMWSPEEGEYVATCIEFPSLSWLAPSQSEALHGMVALVAEVVDDLVTNDEPIPEPFAMRYYSGKFNLRVGTRLHRELALAAAEAGLSLNQYVVQRLRAG